MIVKKVQTNKAAAPKSKAVHARDLCDYIAGPDAGDEGEKVEHRGALNLLNLDHAAQVQEMADLAETAKRSPQPVQHWILSWRQGEQPTAAQADEAVRIFLEEMGLSKHQVIYALHRNTDNLHLHLAINRVHPETEHLTTVNGGFDIEVAHRAIARIEHAHGWQRERGGRYHVLGRGEVERTAGPSPLEREPRTRARDFENQTGQRSAQRIAIDEGADIMRRAHSWRELHAVLAERGMRFEKKGSGALLWVGETAVKPSTAGRDCSMSALEKRLGEFVPPTATLEPPSRPPEPIAPAAPGWAEYIAARQTHYTNKKQEREQLGRQHRDQRGGMADRHRQERRDVLGGNWRGKGAALNALRSVLAARQAQEKAALRERHELEREGLRERFPTWPVFEEWLRDRDPDLAEAWRFRERTPAMVIGDSADPARPRDIRAFVSEVRGPEVFYRRAGASRSPPCFADRGRQILIHDLGRDSVLAALQLSAQKWGTFEVSGSDAYKRLCAELAAEHGFRIVNPELQQAIATERERRLRRGYDLHGREAGVRGAPAPALPRVGDVGEAYRRHLEEVRRQHQQGRSDASREDALVAMRLRVTGYSRAEVERAIQEGAARLRSQESRNWSEYGQRAAAHAFGMSGGRTFRELTRDRNALLALEGRLEPSLAVRRRRGPTLGR